MLNHFFLAFEVVEIDYQILLIPYKKLFNLLEILFNFF